MTQRIQVGQEQEWEVCIVRQKEDMAFIKIKALDIHEAQQRALDRVLVIHEWYPSGEARYMSPTIVEMD